MARPLALSVANVRRFLLLLLALGLVLRLGSACEAMAATPVPTIGHIACTDMPAGEHKPLRAVSIECALCAALPVDITAPAGAFVFTPMEIAAGSANSLAGRDKGPAPPPPRIA
ncbi:hypothetical protein GCM10011380_32130 [Sphingomonas metalli]|uniref:DUF2946 domain-containing protein n=1 Tax=Sphingomonas metalli TaxID=1779358 RepID=A0A916TD01_9SPHN|nr:hypothetical protein [Sphingomonas metalli]GGB40253.1 hypothetical protein GCM10011380_32130 [Sphingomonas metalli]